MRFLYTRAARSRDSRLAAGAGEANGLGRSRKSQAGDVFGCNLCICLWDGAYPIGALGISSISHRWRGLPILVQSGNEIMVVVAYYDGRPGSMGQDSD
jgi:hypothetical protein